MSDSIERRKTSKLAAAQGITKKDLALRLVNLPFKRQELNELYDMKRDVKNFIETGATANDKLDMLFDTILKRFK